MCVCVYVCVLLFQLFWRSFLLLPRCGSLGRLGMTPPVEFVFIFKCVSCIFISVVMDLAEPVVYLLLFVCMS